MITLRNVTGSNEVPRGKLDYASFAVFDPLLCEIIKVTSFPFNLPLSCGEKGGAQGETCVPRSRGEAFAGTGDAGRPKMYRASVDRRLQKNTSVSKLAAARDSPPREAGVRETRKNRIFHGNERDVEIAPGRDKTCATCAASTMTAFCSGRRVDVIEE